MKSGAPLKGKEDLARLLKRVVDTLERTGKRYALLKFPTSYRERSIDLIAVDSAGENVVIRIKSSSKITREEAKDLINASLALDSIPIAISSDPLLFDNVIYEKEGIYLMNERTFENLYTKPNEIIALYRKGDLYLEVNKEFIKKERLKHELSLSDASYLLNLSRKMIYQYEKEGGMVTVETAEKLVDTFGAKAISPINHRVMRTEFVEKARREADITTPAILKKVVTGKVYTLKKSAPDYIVRSERVSTVVDATGEDYSLRKVIKKVTECIKLSDMAWEDVHLMVSPERVNSVMDGLSTQISLNRIKLHKIRGSVEGR